MTVGELIEALKTYPLDMPCVSVGFDQAGYYELGEVAEFKVKPVSGWLHDFVKDEGGTPVLLLR